MKDPFVQLLDLPDCFHMIENVDHRKPKPRLFDDKRGPLAWSFSRLVFVDQNPAN